MLLSLPSFSFVLPVAVVGSTCVMRVLRDIARTPDAIDNTIPRQDIPKPVGSRLRGPFSWPTQEARRALRDGDPHHRPPTWTPGAPGEALLQGRLCCGQDRRRPRP